MKGRGSSQQPINRFTNTELETDPEYLEYLHQTGEASVPSTQVLADSSRSVISRNRSPDIDFTYSLNPYRGCEHGCSYCYARPSHEFLGFSAGLDFETKIIAKPEAPQLLREALSKKSWKGEHLVMSGVTDPYQPKEKELQITRGCLSVAAEFRQPVEIITKNYGVTRDLDLLQRLASYNAASVRISITSLDPKLSRRLEPRASAPERRLQAVARLSEGGVPVGVNVSPVIPGLNDHEVPAIISAAKEAGAQWVHYIPLRLPGAVAEVFLGWLDEFEPNRKDKVVRLVRELRGGRLNQSRFHTRFQGEGEVARRLQQFFDLARKKVGLPSTGPTLTSEHFKVPGPEQLELF